MPFGQVGGWQHPKEGWDVEADGQQTVTPLVPGCTVPPSALLCHPQGHADPIHYSPCFSLPQLNDDLLYEILCDIINVCMDNNAWIQASS